jgi:hypothetical protein
MGMSVVLDYMGFWPFYSGRRELKSFFLFIFMIAEIVVPHVS